MSDLKKGVTDSVTAQRRDGNVFILGAGFSAPAGAPLISNFLDRAREFYDNPASELDAEECKHFERVFDFKRKMAHAREKVIIDLDDIEQLFGLVEMSYRLGKVEKETRNSTVYLIAKTLQLAIADPKWHKDRFGLLLGEDAIARLNNVLKMRDKGRVSTTNCFIDVYDYFAALVSGLLDNQTRVLARENTIITFNYDLVVDDALVRVGCRPRYFVGQDVPETTLVPGQHPGCALLKLHGSANRGICDQGHVVVLNEKFTDSPHVFRSMRCSKCDATFQPLLIPPSWDKSEHPDILAPVWAKAVDAIRLATRICIIGYSIRESDAFFKYLLTLALSENYQLYRLIVVDLVQATPAVFGSPPEQTPEGPVQIRYRQLLDPLFQKRRFSFYDCGLVSYLHGGASRIELNRGDDVKGQLSLYGS